MKRLISSLIGVFGKQYIAAAKDSLWKFVPYQKYLFKSVSAGWARTGSAPFASVSAVTFECVFKMNSFPPVGSSQPSRYLFSYGSSNRGLSLRIANGGLNLITVRTASGLRTGIEIQAEGNAIGGQAEFLGKYVRLVISAGAERITWYRGGVLLGYYETTASDTFVIANNLRLAIANYSGTDAQFTPDVDIALLRVWSVAKTDAEVLSLESGIDANTANLHLHYLPGAADKAAGKLINLAATGSAYDAPITAPASIVNAPLLKFKS